MFSSDCMTFHGFQVSEVGSLWPPFVAGVQPLYKPLLDPSCLLFHDLHGIHVTKVFLGLMRFHGFQGSEIWQLVAIFAADV